MVTVKETDDEEENNEAVPIVSVTEALECLDKFTNFLRQNSVNVSVTADFLSELRYVQRSLTLEKAYCMKQSTLDHFYNLNQHWENKSVLAVNDVHVIDKTNVCYTVN